MRVYNHTRVRTARCRVAVSFFSSTQRRTRASRAPDSRLPAPFIFTGASRARPCCHNHSWDTHSAAGPRHGENRGQRESLRHVEPIPRASHGAAPPPTAELIYNAQLVGGASTNAPPTHTFWPDALIIKTALDRKSEFNLFGLFTKEFKWIELIWRFLVFTFYFSTLLILCTVLGN